MWKDDLTKSIEEYNNSKKEFEFSDSNFKEDYKQEILEEYSSQDIVPKIKTIWNNIAIVLVSFCFFSIIFLAFSVRSNPTDEDIKNQKPIYAQSLEYSSEEGVVYDRIVYNNFNVGEKYTITSKVIDKKTGDVVSTKDVTFYPKEANGVLKVEHQLSDGEYTIYESLE